MNKKIILGQVRELLMIVGMLLFAGNGETTGVSGVVGLIMAAVSLGWAIRYHEGKEVIFTSIRKLINMVPAVLVFFRIVDMDTAMQIATAALATTSLAWSAVSNSKNK